MKFFGYRWKTASGSDPRTFSLTVDLEDGLWFACVAWRRRRHELRVQPLSAEPEAVPNFFGRVKP